MVSIVSISGGKDSTALWLWARRAGLSPRVIVFFTHFHLYCGAGGGRVDQ